MSQRAVECRSFSRALFHWEQYIRQFTNRPQEQQSIKLEPLYEHLQKIYSQIDEPDGIEGISTHLHVLDIDQQVLEHRKAGRWATAQSWYELQLEQEPDNLDAQWNLFTCLKESGQHGNISNSDLSWPLTDLPQMQYSHVSRLFNRRFPFQGSFLSQWNRLG